MVFIRRSQLDTILVTGCPRSGTTAVGDILASMPRSQYLYEPLNAVTGDKAINAFFAIPESSDLSAMGFDDLISRIRRLDLDLKPGISKRDSRGMKTLKAFTGGRSRLSLLRCQTTPNLGTLIWKDPFASLATSHIATRHGIPVIVTSRSVFATAASFKRLGWGFNLQDLHDRLVSSGREPVIPREKLDIGDGALNGAALWALIYTDILRASRQYPDRIKVVRTDEFIASPLAAYSALFEWLGRPFGDGVRKKIARVYQDKSKAPDMPSDRAHDRNRDLSKVGTYWHSVLSSEEIGQIRDLLEHTEALELYENVPSLLQAEGEKTAGASVQEA